MNFVLVQLKLRKQSINIKHLTIYYIDYFQKFHYLRENRSWVSSQNARKWTEELRESLWTENVRKQKRISCSWYFYYGELCHSVKTADKVEENLKKEYEKKLTVVDRLVHDKFNRFQIPHGLLEEDEGTAFWPIWLYPDIFNHLNLFRIGFFWAAHVFEGGGRQPHPPPRLTLPKICYTYRTMIKLCIVIPYLNKIQKIYK